MSGPLDFLQTIELNVPMNKHIPTHRLRAGMVGIGMIFDETYRPFFERTHAAGMYDRRYGDVAVELSAVASRTGKRADAYLKSAADRIAPCQNYHGSHAIEQMLEGGIDFGCVATPDDRHFEGSKAILAAGAHLLVEKPSVLTLSELDQLVALAKEKNVLAKVVYHKLLDPDHKKLRT
ncbi:MAG: Gfo/Idh/MocA family protein, partial [Planctomycetaceae bacterium]